MQPDVAAFFDEETFTVSYLVSDPETRRAAVIDSVLDFDPASGRTRRASVDRIVAHVEKAALKVDWVLETHVHADHVSAGDILKHKLGGQSAIGEHVRTVQDAFARIFNTGSGFTPDGRQFDRLFTDGDAFKIGKLDSRAMHTPGHTPACITYVIGDAAFVGDTLFMPDFGTARCDFPGGDAAELYRSIRKILALPDETRIFVGHDYLVGERTDFRWQSAVAEERASNVHVGAGADEAAYVEM